MYAVEKDPIALALYEYGKTPLLSLIQEKVFTRQAFAAQQIIDFRQELEVKGNTVSDEELAAHFEIGVEELQQRLSAGKKAKERIIKANMRLVVSIAARYQRRGVEFLDLIQEGAIGLNRAIEKFDPNKGYKLSTYATWWIRQAVTRCIANNCRSVRLPIHVTEKLNKIKATCKDLGRELQRYPTDAEIAERMNISVKDLKQLLACRRSVLSLNAAVGEKQDSELGDLALVQNTSIDSSPDLFVEQQAKLEAIDKVLDCLPERSRQIIEMRFGLLTGKGMSLQEVADEIGLSRERTRQIQVKAIRQLRHYRGYLGGLIDA